MTGSEAGLNDKKAPARVLFLFAIAGIEGEKGKTVSDEDTIKQEKLSGCMNKSVKNGQ